MTRQLDNIFWHSLSGAHAHLSAGTDSARRYLRGFSPIIGFRDPRDPDFAALLPFCEPGERFYCDAWTGPAPDGWHIAAEATMYRMVWDGALPAPATPAEPLRWPC